MSHPLARAAALFVALLLPIGCSRSEQSERDSSGESAAGSQTDPVTAQRNSDSLRFELHVAPEVRAGEPVPISLRAQNTRDEPLELHLLGRTMVFDVIVSDSAGRVVWRRLQGQTVPAILRVEMLAPGQVLEFQETWNQRTNSGEAVGPGVYTLEGTLPTDSPQPYKTPPAQLRIVP